jgi:hypothetical protein
MNISSSFTTLSSTSDFPYSSRSYWDLRYATAFSLGQFWFDWYSDIDSELELLLSTNRLFPRSFILVLGCGTSSVIKFLLERKFINTLFIDWSSVLIDRLRLEFPDSSSQFINSSIETVEISSPVDFILDKGCLDCFFCSPTSSALDSTLLHLSKALKSTGLAVFISCFPPNDRILNALKKPKYEWKVECKEENKDKQKEENSHQTLCFAYFCQKIPPNESNSL